jgi:hypothetical protein
LLLRVPCIPKRAHRILTRRLESLMRAFAVPQGKTDRPAPRQLAPGRTWTKDPANVFAVIQGHYEKIEPIVGL